MHINIVGFFDCCDKPKAKKAADLSSTILWELNFLFDAKPIANGTFLDPGEITTSRKSKLRHDKINVCATVIISIAR